MIRRLNVGIAVAFLISSLFFSNYISAMFVDIDYGQYDQQEDQEADTTQDSTLTETSEVEAPSILSKLVTVATNANYYTTNKLVLDADLIDFSNLDYQLTIDLGCRGAGSVLRPLQAAKIAVGKKQVESSASVANITFADAFMDSAKTQFNKYAGKDFDLLKKLSGFELSPLHVFMIKTILLAKTEVDQSHFAQEVAKLMMRLSITEPYRSNVGSYLNFAHDDQDFVTKILSKVLIKVLPQDWMVALQSAAQCIESPAAYNAGMKTKVLIFGKKDPKNKTTDTIIEDAKNVINACEDKNKCLTKLNEFLKQRGYDEVTDNYARFEKFNQGKINPFIGKICFMGSLHDLPTGDLRSEVMNNAGSSQAVIINADGRPFGPFVITFPCDTLGVRDSACAMTALLIKAFQDYVMVKFPFTQPIDSKNLEQLDAQADQQALVRAFLMTSEGQDSQERLAQELKECCSFDSSKIKTLMTEVKKQLVVLKNQQSAVAAAATEFADTLAANSDCFEDDDIEEKKQDLNNQKTTIIQKIKTIEQQLADYSMQIKNTDKKAISLEHKLQAREEAVKIYRSECSTYFAHAFEELYSYDPVIQGKRDARTAYAFYLLRTADAIEEQNRTFRDFLVMEKEVNAHHALNISSYEKLRLVLAPIINDNEFFGLSVQSQDSMINLDFIIDDLMGNNSAFDGVRALLLQCKEMLQQSTLLKENKLMAEYLIKLLCPSYASYLSATLL